MSWIPKALKGRRKPSALELLTSPSWPCAGYGEGHEGISPERVLELYAFYGHRPVVD